MMARTWKELSKLLRNAKIELDPDSTRDQLVCLTNTIYIIFYLLAQRASHGTTRISRENNLCLKMNWGHCACGVVLGWRRENLFLQVGKFCRSYVFWCTYAVSKFWNWLEFFLTPDTKSSRLKSACALSCDRIFLSWNSICTFIIGENLSLSSGVIECTHDKLMNQVDLSSSVSNWTDVQHCY